MGKENKRYYWFKMQADFFKDKKIKKLRSIAGGDTFTIIYLKMLLRSLENMGVITFEGIENTFIEEIAFDIDEDANNVGITVDFLLKTGLMVQLSETEFALVIIPELIDSECASAKRVREFRERKEQALLSNNQALLSNNLPSENVENSTLLQCNGQALQSNHIERRKDIDIEIDIDIEREKKNTETKSQLSPTIIPDVFNAYSKICKSLPQVRKRSASRIEAIYEILKQHTFDEIIEVFTIAESSEFLKGKKGFKASFDWLMTEEFFLKTLEGTYTDETVPSSGQKKSQFNNFSQRNQDFSELEKKMLGG